MEEILQRLQASGIAAQAALPLCRYTSFRIGGPAALAVFPTNEVELILAHELLSEAGVQITVLGKGSNVLAPDEGICGAVLFTTQMRSLSCDGDRITADAGVPLSRIAGVALEASLSGAEFAQGIPGTLGGAVAMNAGAYGTSLQDVLVLSRYYDTVGRCVREIPWEAHGFAYRESIYTKDPSRILLSATLELVPGEQEEIHRRMVALAERRRQSQPLEHPSAGSVFKRPPGAFAGKLIEDCGLKGLRVGDAEVSLKHAGFIVNRGNATAVDVRALIGQIRQTVRERYGVLLECELRILDP